MEDICKKYFKLIKDKYGDYIITAIFYGSNIYPQNNYSDLDVCLITNRHDLDIDSEIINTTIDFHKNNNLKLDYEIPFENKLIYDIEEINKFTNISPFYKNGEFIIEDIIKNKKFLNSVEMKQRLLLNILTTEHKSYGAEIENAEFKAYKIIIDAIIGYFRVDVPTPSTILELMYENKYTGSSGEMYLGYKKNNSQKMKYLQEKVTEYINDRFINE